MRIDALDDFAVELEHQTQHAMRCRMLRAEIDGEVTDVVLRVHRLGGDRFRHGGEFCRHLGRHGLTPAFSSPGSVG